MKEAIELASPRAYFQKMKIPPVLCGLALMITLGIQPVSAQAPRDTNVVLKNPRPFKTICYSGYRKGQGPGWAEPTEQQVREDLTILAAYTHEIRTYGSGVGTHGNVFVPKICDELGLKLHLGVWVDPTYSDSVNLKAVDEAIAVAKKGYASIKSVIVGNEYMYRVRSSGKPSGPEEARLISYIKKARAGVPTNIAVTNADTWGDWMANSDSLIASIDYLLWHTHPWWEKKSIDDVEAHMEDVHNKIKARLAARFKDKREVLGEVGWPSLADNPPAVGSEANQVQFFKSLHSWAWRQNFEYWSFAAFDESWKDSEGPVGTHWGLWNIDRSPKPIISEIAAVIPRYMQWDSDESVSVVRGNFKVQRKTASSACSRCQLRFDPLGRIHSSSAGNENANQMLSQRSSP